MCKKSIRFVAFADFHYREGIYTTNIEDIEGIFERAHECGADLVLSAGDMNNDCIRSPEFIEAFKNNKYGLPALNVYGNHEIELPGNCMEIVTPNIVNRPVVWGTPDGEIGDGRIAYYHYDVKGFRFIGIDSNYSFNPETNEFEHNRDGSFAPPRENTLEAALHPDELVWLERVVLDAAEKGLHCIVTAHHTFNGHWDGLSPDWRKVQEIYRKGNEARHGTVMMSVNGHTHTDRCEVVDEILYLDVNSTRNGLINSTPHYHYADPKNTYVFTEHDDDGNVIDVRERPVFELLMSPHTWYFTDALSAVVTVCEDGEIMVEGKESTWYNGIAPVKEDGAREVVRPRISSGRYNLYENN